jgi:arginine/lysine/ornithine decarboxylase
MKTPLSDAVNAKKAHVSFHTPAHSGVLSSEDITELSYSGNLLTHSGAIGESERLVAEAYGADEAFYVTSGATTAIHAAMSIFAGETFLVFGPAHKSVFSGLRQYAGKAFYLDALSELSKALDAINPQVLIATSPDYFGNVLDMEQIDRLCKAKHIALIIDASHGAHFPFCTQFPVKASLYGDLVIHSLHKTLPVMTGGALLLTTERYREKAVFALCEVHTSSPSYPVMLSIERAVAGMCKNGEQLWEKTLQEIRHFAVFLPAPYEMVKNDDPTRLVLRSPYDGETVAAALEARGIYPEMSYRDTVVFIVNPFNADKLIALSSALADMKNLSCASKEGPDIRSFPEAVEIRTKGRWESVPLEAAQGRILYREIGYYPPGVPLFLPGSILSAEDIARIDAEANRLFGLDKGCVFVVI